MIREPPPLFNRSISRPVSLSFFPTLSRSLLLLYPSLSLPPSYLFVQSSASLQQLCAGDYMPLNSLHKQLLVYCPAVYWCFGLNIQWPVCVCICFTVHHQRRHEDKIERLEIVFDFLFFHPLCLPSLIQLLKSTRSCVMSWLNVCLRVHTLLIGTRLSCRTGGLWLFSVLALTRQWEVG